jgi:hypothetical protein
VKPEAQQKMKKAVISDRMNIGHNLLASSSLGILAVNANQYPNEYRISSNPFWNLLSKNPTAR